MASSIMSAVRVCEDLTTLQACVGTEVYCSDWETITQDRVTQFAQVTGDLQWIHVDPIKARQDSPYGGTIAHGFFTLALLGKYYELFLPQLLPFCDIAINYGLDRVRFTQAVCVGSKVRGRFLLQSARLEGEFVRLAFEVQIEIENQNKPACVAHSIVLRRLTKQPS